MDENKELEEQKKALKRHALKHNLRPLKRNGRMMLGAALARILMHQPHATAQRAADILYLAETEMAHIAGMPITMAPWYIWKRGPVSVDILEDLRDSNPDAGALCGHAVVPTGKSRRPLKVNPENVDYSVLERYDGDILPILDEIAQKYGDIPDEKMHEMLCGEGTPWRTQAVETGVMKAFEEGSAITSTMKVQFPLIAKDEDGRDLLDTIHGSAYTIQCVQLHV